MGNGFNKDKLKVQSKMGANRIALQSSKKENELMKRKREIAILVNNGKTNKARIKVESIIRDENIILVYDLVGNFCELIHQRAAFIAQEKTCPEDLLEAISTILYSAPRCDVKELTELGQLFGAKFGKKFVEAYKENRSGHVSGRVVAGLSTAPPPFDKVVAKLQEICRSHDVAFDADTLAEELGNPPAATTASTTESVDQDKVEKLVRYLMDPSTFDMTDEMKLDLCKSHGGNPSESSAALSAAKFQIQQQQQAAAAQQQMPIQPIIPQQQQQIPQQNQARQREYTVTFRSRPFGMQWTETSDQKNLYVSSVDMGLLAHQLGVTEGSLIIQVNGRVVENLGAAQVFQISKAQPLPLSITFRALQNTVPQPQVMSPQVMQPVMQPAVPQPVPVAQPALQPAPPSYEQIAPNVQTIGAEPAHDAFNLPDVPGQGAEGESAAFGLPDVPGQGGPDEKRGPDAKPGGDDDMDDLEARFAALRNGL